MKQTKIKFFTAIALSFMVHYAQTQGCSDAGFCTIGSIKPNSNFSALENKNQIKAGVSLGSADKAISIFGNYIEFNRQISNNFGVDAKITSLSQAGNGVTAFGISDLYINGNYDVNKNLKLILGAKIPFNDGNKKKDNIALPMDYQSSLGTFDLILGMGYKVKKLQFVLAFQQPLSQNKNEFIGESYAVNSKIREFQSTNQFKRSGDVLLRASYPITLSKKIKITPSLLPIYHLTQDKYTNALGVESKIKGSQGLTLNANMYLDYEINGKNGLQLNMGLPFVVRDTRPDGLTRSFVANLEYRIRF